MDKHAQIYHHCAIGNRYDFLCPNYTLFDQTTFTCRFINTVDCDGSTKHYDRNNALYIEKDENNNNKKDQSTTSTTTTASPPLAQSTSTTTTSTPAPKLNIQMSKRFGLTHSSASSAALDLATHHHKLARDHTPTETPKADTAIK